MFVVSFFLIFFFFFLILVCLFFLFLFFPFLCFKPTSSLVSFQPGKTILHLITLVFLNNLKPSPIFKNIKSVMDEQSSPLSASASSDTFKTAIQDLLSPIVTEIDARVTGVYDEQQALLKSIDELGEGVKR